MKRKTTAQKIQEWHDKYGELSLQTEKKIDRLVKQYAKTQSISINKDNQPYLPIGTKLIREFKGRKYEVTVLENGYSCKDKIYKSLSSIANKITGTRWNGKRFFGVKK